jgi:hypothetical protein
MLFEGEVEGESKVKKLFCGRRMVAEYGWVEKRTRQVEVVYKTALGSSNPTTPIDERNCLRAGG